MIAVDWGTSSFRAYQLDATGEITDRRSSAAGLLMCHGEFEAVLTQELRDWNDELIVMGGMIGSRNGWQEVPYVQCPAGIDTIAAGMREVATSSMGGRRVFIAPGLSTRSHSGLREVMRGEETQLLGLFGRLVDDERHTVCLPGTHSKWVSVRGGYVEDFHTAMTGELYAVLKAHSLLGALMTETDKEYDDETAFALGVATSAQDGGLLNHLFSVRTRSLFGELAAAQLSSYLSGLLIGHELRGLLAATRRVHLIGGTGLILRYQRALMQLGIESSVHEEALAARGLHRLACAAGLIELETDGK